MAASQNEKTVSQASNQSEKDKALESALQNIQKQFGKGSIMKLGDTVGLNIDTISTGSLSLDLATGVGGVPRGRITEIYGPESSGKTTLALHIVAEAQKTGGRAAFIDAEHALDPEYSANLGVDINELLVSQPDTGEQALEICEALVRSGAIDVIVIDSVAALVPKAEIQGDMGDSHVGLHARLMSQALRKLAAFINKSNTCVIFINQLREKVGVMFGNPEVTTGGRALKFYATMRIDVRRVEGIKSGDQFIGNRTRAKVVKNKVAPPFKQAEFDIMYGEGISRVGDTLDCAVEHKIVDKAGSWYSFEGTRIGQGRENAKRYLSENEEMLNRIESLVMESVKSKPDEDKDDKSEGKENKSDKKTSGKKAVGKSDAQEDTGDIFDDISDEISDDMDMSESGLDEPAGFLDMDFIDEEMPLVDLETGEIIE